MPGDWSHWLFMGLVVFLALLFLAARFAIEHPKHHGLRRVTARQAPMVRVVDPSTPLTKQRFIFDQDERDAAD
jgi:hypothetical protein